MLAAIDWNEVLLKAQIGGVLGAIGGACAGVIAYLTHKSDAKKQSEWEARERARIHAQAGANKADSAKTIPVWFILFVILAIIGGVLVANPSLVGRALNRPGAASGESKPSATVLDYGRYRGQGPLRVQPDRNASGGVSVVSDKEFLLLEQTDQIPCRVGESWGFRIRSSDVPTDRPYTVRKETYHPPMKQPDGSVRTKSVGEFKLRPGAPPDPFCGWHFLKDYEYELVAGEWTLVVFIDDVEVARKVFNIRK